MGGGRAENMQTDQPHDRGHAVAIYRQGFKGCVAGCGEVHFHAFNELLEVGFGNRELLGMVRQTDHERPRGFAAVGQLELGPPTAQLFLGMASGWRLIDGAIYGLAKSVDRIHGIALGFREEEK